MNAALEALDADATSGGGVRILHVSQPVEAGVARVVAGLVADQRARGWDVAVACPPQGWLADQVRATGARLVPWRATRAPGPTVPAEALALRRVVRDTDPQLVHLHSSKAGLAGRLALRGSRQTVFQPHSWSFEAVTGPLQAACRMWERAAQRWTHLTVNVSEAERSSGRAAGVAGASVVVPNGVDPTRWTPGDRATARRELSFPDPAAPTVVCVGRLARQKGQDLMLAAWPAVRAAVPGARLVLIGDGPDEAQLRAQADESVTIVAGQQLELWYAAADVVAVPSRWEAGLPLVAMEAMASERALVAFDVAGIGSSLDGAGAAVPAFEVPALAAQLVIRLLDPKLAAKEGAVGRDVATTRFSAATSQAATAAQLLGLRQRT
ncbi:glycosyltransferase [Modestobacter roseus]|uniref:Glycosyltransferase involved in cell wall biosynthesis n=1 Tax=Modestobacter roseus TaxID=1181884 RepID=A0A562IWU7_9ACTN|nr:glycosyltransferase [Modestobacter roseus]MQA34003.1 glycosyltransferase [Modestobacter roseus]TWH75362.1 glycosyltransferase involved in cell wall biosynthesis [Modestobacter roseus]